MVMLDRHVFFCKNQVFRGFKYRYALLLLHYSRSSKFLSVLSSFLESRQEHRESGRGKEEFTNDVMTSKSMSTLFYHWLFNFFFFFSTKNRLKLKNRL